jgi:THO complex subunit 2
VVCGTAELLDAGGVITKADLTKKEIKYRTKVYYRQQKFNLLREESEGFAKLITELNRCFAAPEPGTLYYPLIIPFVFALTSHMYMWSLGAIVGVDEVVERVNGFIGFFDLDPNRVIGMNQL